MSSPGREAAIVGVYKTQQARKLGRTSISLQIESIKGALADAGLSHTDVDGVVPLDPVPAAWQHPSVSPAMFWAEQFGERPLTFMGTNNGIAQAVAAIGAGMCKVAVIFWGNGGWRIGPGGTTRPTTAPRVAGWNYSMQGAYMTPWYALWAQRYMHEFGVTSEDLAEVAVIARDYAVDNPEAVMGPKGRITVDDVVNSRMIADPLHLLDCSIENEGGYAIVLTSADVAKDCKKSPVWVLGAAESVYTDSYNTIDVPWFPEDGKSVRRAADQAFDMAGVTRDDMQVAELYDCFTITMLRDLEEMGFCKLGEAADYVKEGNTRRDGKMPANTDGGLLSASHCGNPWGMQVIELVHQLRNECGLRQVDGASLGVALAQGAAVHGYAAVAVLGRD